MRKRKALMAASLMLALVVCASAVALAFSGSDQSGDAGAMGGVDGKPAFIGKPALVVGDSSETGIIVNQLLKSTDNVTRAPSISDMPGYRFDGVIIVDGTWAAGEPTVELADALSPYVLGGMPVLMVNMTTDIITIIGAEGNHPFEGVSTYADGILVKLNGFWYRPTDGFISSISLGSRDPASDTKGITALYEWGALRA